MLKISTINDDRIAGVYRHSIAAGTNGSGSAATVDGQGVGEEGKGGGGAAGYYNGRPCFHRVVGAPSSDPGNSNSTAVAAAVAPPCFLFFEPVLAQWAFASRDPNAGDTDQTTIELFATSALSAEAAGFATFPEDASSWVIATEAGAPSPEHIVQRIGWEDFPINICRLDQKDGELDVSSTGQFKFDGVYIPRRPYGGTVSVFYTQIFSFCSRILSMDAHGLLGLTPANEL
jgi:hypothetical protein